MKCCERKVKVWIKESKKIAHTTLSAHTWVWNDTGIENPWKTMLQNMSRVCVRYVRKVLRNPEQCWSHPCVLDPRQQQIEDQVWAAHEHTEHTVLEHTEHTILEHTEHTALEHTQLTHVLGRVYLCRKIEVLGCATRPIKSWARQL